MWPEFCIRDGQYIKDNGEINQNSTDIFDGWGCHYDSYANLTQLL